MLESDAVQKWCPFARTISVKENPREIEVPVSFNRIHVVELNQGAIVAGSKCLASKCMAWRWIDTGTGSGYCGLAGKTS